MSHWQYWPSSPNNKLNYHLGQQVESYGVITYPNLRDSSDLILASDYSGEHEQPQFQVLAFLLTQERSVFCDWEPLRLSVRNQHFADGRRMAFKKLSDSQRIKALP